MFKWLLSSSLVQTRLKKLVNNLSLAAGASTLTVVTLWLSSHGISHADATAIATVCSTAVAGLILAGGSTLYDQLDASRVDSKIVTAAATGSVAAVNDPKLRAATVEAVKTGTLEAPHGYDIAKAAFQDSSVG